MNHNINIGKRDLSPSEVSSMKNFNQIIEKANYRKRKIRIMVFGTSLTLILGLLVSIPFYNDNEVVRGNKSKEKPNNVVLWNHLKKNTKDFWVINSEGKQIILENKMKIYFQPFSFCDFNDSLLQGDSVRVRIYHSLKANEINKVGKKIPEVKGMKNGLYLTANDSRGNKLKLTKPISIHYPSNSVDKRDFVLLKESNQQTQKFVSDSCLIHHGKVDEIDNMNIKTYFKKHQYLMSNELGRLLPYYENGELYLPIETDNKAYKIVKVDSVDLNRFKPLRNKGFDWNDWGIVFDNNRISFKKKLKQANSILLDYNSDEAKGIDLKKGIKVVMIGSFTCRHCQDLYKQMIEVFEDELLMYGYGRQDDVDYFKKSIDKEEIGKTILVEDINELIRLSKGKEIPLVVVLGDGKELYRSSFEQMNNQQRERELYNIKDLIRNEVEIGRFTAKASLVDKIWLVEKSKKDCDLILKKEGVQLAEQINDVLEKVVIINDFGVLLY